MKNDAAEMEKGELVITRVFDAPRARVWKAWTEPEEMKKWWGPKGFTAPHISIDLRVGGRCVRCMRGTGFDGVVKDYWDMGEFREIVPLEKLVLSTSFADEQGNPVPPSYYGMPGEWPAEATQTFTFEDAEGGKTKVTIRQTGISAEMIEPTRMGWGQSLDKVAASLT